LLRTGKIEIGGVAKRDDFFAARPGGNLLDRNRVLAMRRSLTICGTDGEPRDNASRS
jgi:hypothetical protein